MRQQAHFAQHLTEHNTLHISPCPTASPPSGFPFFFFFFNDTATTEIYTLSLHDALPICPGALPGHAHAAHQRDPDRLARQQLADRKSTRLNSSHANISYAVFCLKKKKKKARR